MTDVAQTPAPKHTNGLARREMTSKGSDKENGRRASNGPPKLEKRQSYSSNTGDDAAVAKKDSTKKRRKVNHGGCPFFYAHGLVSVWDYTSEYEADGCVACIYCRRSVSIGYQPRNPRMWRLQPPSRTVR